MRPHFCWPHDGEDRAHAQKNTGDIDMHHAFPLVQGNFPERSLLQGCEYRGVIDQHIDPAELGNSRFRHGFNGCLVADIDSDRGSIAARRHNFSLNAISIGVINVSDDNSGARCGELTGKFAPNSLSGSCNDDDPVLNAEITRVRRHTRIRGAWTDVDVPC